MGAIADLIERALAQAIGGALSDIANWLTTLFTMVMTPVGSMLDITYVRNTFDAMVWVSESLLAVALGVEVLRSYIFWVNGDAEADPGGLLRRAAYSMMVAAGGWTITRYVVDFAGTMVNAITNVPGIAVERGDWWRLAAKLAQLSQVRLAIIIAILLAVVLMLIVFVQSAIRAVEVAFLTVISPIVAVGLLRANEGLWGVWWREIVSLTLSQAAQVFLLKGAIVALLDFTNSWLVYSQLFFAIAWLWVAIKAPNIMRQFAYHTGLGGAAMSGAQTGGSLLIWRMLSKGA